MTDEEKQKNLDAVRNFLDRNDGRPLLIAGVALCTDGTLDGCRLPHGIDSADAAVELFGGMFLAAIGSCAPQDTKIKLLSAGMGRALMLLEADDTEAADE